MTDTLADYAARGTAILPHPWNLLALAVAATLAALGPGDALHAHRGAVLHELGSAPCALILFDDAISAVGRSTQI